MFYLLWLQPVRLEIKEQVTVWVSVIKPHKRETWSIPKSFWLTASAYSLIIITSGVARKTVNHHLTTIKEHKISFPFDQRGQYSHSALSYITDKHHRWIKYKYPSTKHPSFVAPFKKNPTNVPHKPWSLPLTGDWDFNYNWTVSVQVDSPSRDCVVLWLGRSSVPLWTAQWPPWIGIRPVGHWHLSPEGTYPF